MANEEKISEEIEGEGDNQVITESPAVGLNGSVLVLHKELNDYISENREVRSHADQCHHPGIFKSQKSDIFLEVRFPLFVGILKM